MIVLARRLAFILALFAWSAHAEDGVIAPGSNLLLDGLPPIPAEIAAKVAPYTEFKPSGVLAWHPRKRELLIRQRLRNTSQVHRVAEPGVAPEPLTDFP